MTEKRCSKCGQIKSIVEFAIKRRSKDGRQGWCKGCMKEYIKEYMKGWYVKNPRYYKEYYTDHRKERLKCGEEYYLRNREKHLERVKEYNKLHPETKKMHWRLRRYRVRAVGDLTIETIQRVYEDNIKRFGTLTCYYDRKPIKFGDDSLDHKIPVSRGGTNDYDNLCIACMSCNRKKFTKTEAEFMELIRELGGLSEEVEKVARV